MDSYIKKKKNSVAVVLLMVARYRINPMDPIAGRIEIQWSVHVNQQVLQECSALCIRATTKGLPSI